MRSWVDLNGDNLWIYRAYLRISDHCRVRVGVTDCCIQTDGKSDKMRINHVIKADQWRSAPLRILLFPNLMWCLLTFSRLLGTFRALVISFVPCRSWQTFHAISSAFIYDGFISVPSDTAQLCEILWQYSMLSFLASTFLLYSSGLSRLISTSEVLYCTMYNVILIFHSIYDVSYSCRVRNVIFFLLWLQGNFCFVFSATDWWTACMVCTVHARVVCNSVYFSDLHVSDVCYNLCCPSSIVISTLLATYCLADCYYISTGPMWAPVL